uniref:Chemokine interleukin-8-like domain-containing protein n=1 Tax=Monopterus albus TaxID=43700 RepID=A0A3Q3R3P7_MONAL
MGHNVPMSVVVAAVLVALTESGSADEKMAPCCTTVGKQEISEPILRYWVHKSSPPCVRAVIFETERGLFCSHLRAPWVGPKIAAFEKTKRQSTRLSAVSPSRISLLSIITSTASPSLVSSTTSERPASESLSDVDNK